MPSHNCVFAVSKNPTIKTIVLNDPHSETQDMMKARQLAAEAEAMRRDFEAEGWDSEQGESAKFLPHALLAPKDATTNLLSAQVSAIFDFSTAAGTRDFLDLVNSGLTYTNGTFTDLTAKHSALLVKNRFATTYLAAIHTHSKVIEQKPDRTEANLDKMAAYYTEINEKAPILRLMKNREGVYVGVLKVAGEMMGKLETIERVARSLLAKQLETGLVGNGEGVRYLAIAMKCIDSEWASVQTKRLGIAKELQQENKVRIKDFVTTKTG